MLFLLSWFEAPFHGYDLAQHIIIQRDHQNNGHHPHDDGIDTLIKSIGGDLPSVVRVLRGYILRKRKRLLQVKALHGAYVCAETDSGIVVTFPFGAICTIELDDDFPSTDSVPRVEKLEEKWWNKTSFLFLLWPKSQGNGKISCSGAVISVKKSTVQIFIVFICSYIYQRHCKKILFFKEHKCMLE